MGIVFLLCACSTPTDREKFYIANQTGETITVQWKGEAAPFATIAPEDGMSLSIPADRCSRAPAADTLIAHAQAGKTFMYGPPICYGATWKIGK
ncbi:hypothetical protein AB0H88_19835 [Nonomuraea sp. NPDC050680]|uniref:hypothetical protein n=1 Tax=Nonomuraea sp. NPDC050680 TaxID=3154630 RepID=UPI0034047036